MWGGGDAQFYLFLNNKNGFVLFRFHFLEISVFFRILWKLKNNLIENYFPIRLFYYLELFSSGLLSFLLIQLSFSLFLSFFLSLSLCSGFLSLFYSFFLSIFLSFFLSYLLSTFPSLSLSFWSSSFLLSLSLS